MSLLSTLLWPKIDQILKPLGFSRKGHCWYRSLSDGLQLVCCETSQLKSEGVSRFTVSCGLFREDVYEVTWGKHAPKNPRQIDCYLRRRIGELTRDRRDRWWTLRVDDDSHAREAGQIVSDLIIPFLDEVSEPSRALDALRHDASQGHERPLSTIYLAVVSALSGSVENDFRELLLSASKLAPAWSERCHEVEQRLISRVS